MRTDNEVSHVPAAASARTCLTVSGTYGAKKEYGQGRLPADVERGASNGGALDTSSRWGILSQGGARGGHPAPRGDWTTSRPQEKEERGGGEKEEGGEGERRGRRESERKGEKEGCTPAHVLNQYALSHAPRPRSPPAQSRTKAPATYGHRGPAPGLRRHPAGASYVRPPRTMTTYTMLHPKMSDIAWH